MNERPYSRKEVVNIIQSVLGNIGKDTEAARKLHDDLSSLAVYIQNMRAELAQMRSIEISHNHIPSATDELDAVIGETAKATGTIMDSCDKIEHIGQGLDDTARAEMMTAITAIYEACSFQDITGQRITKVVKTLKNIENKVAEILNAFGHSLDTTNSAVFAHEAGKGDPDPAPTSLLNGPQLNGPSVKQDEIDKLLASFDK